MDGSVTPAEDLDHVQTPVEEVWYLKDIYFRPEPDTPPKHFKIVTQNFNGPCSFIAICNILILRGHIEILPRDRTSVTYDFLSQLVAEYLLTACPDVDISAALSIMPVTRKGMDLNPLFTGATSFRPAGAGGELKLFEQAGIKLVHGWLADPDSQEYKTLSKTEDYDSSVNLLVEADHVTRGRLVLGEDVPSSSSGPSPDQLGHSLTDAEQQKVLDAIVIRDFIDRTQSQLTYYGLFNLASALTPGSLVALFRNSHLSVLYKSSGDESALYTLVTDQVFLHEASVVWERLEDVDGGWSTFVDSDFMRSSPAGGDYAGHTAESALAELERQTGALSVSGQADQELARQLQAEEDERAREIYARRERERAEKERALKVEKHHASAEAIRKPKKKTDCIIM
ncbi:Protein FAM63A [Grifola frondosa]|uniref:Protein FAM63A n=1 Tax=Grifola frondosa TaxID=5627 RepID=A0A1C7M6M5_GRIFR|nr:Protein FAM63A [Grifola frondosa]